LEDDPERETQADGLDRGDGRTGRNVDAFAFERDRDGAVGEGGQASGKDRHVEPHERPSGKPRTIRRPWTFECEGADLQNPAFEDDAKSNADPSTLAKTQMVSAAREGERAEPEREPARGRRLRSTVRPDEADAHARRGAGRAPSEIEDGVCRDHRGLGDAGRRDAARSDRQVP